MSQEILIGVDIGTSRLKAVATDLKLKVLAEYAEPTPWKHEKNFSDIDMLLLAKTVITVAAKAETIESSVSTTGSIVDEYTFNINADSPAVLTKIAGVATTSAGTPVSLSDTWTVSKINKKSYFKHDL